MRLYSGSMKEVAGLFLLLLKWSCGNVKEMTIERLNQAFLTEESPGPWWLLGWFGWWGLWRWDPKETRQEQVEGKRWFAAWSWRRYQCWAVSTIVGRMRISSPMSLSPGTILFKSDWLCFLLKSKKPEEFLIQYFCTTVANICRVAVTKMGRRNRRRRQQLRRRETSLMPAIVSKRFHGFMHVSKKSFCFYLWKTRTTRLPCMAPSERPRQELKIDSPEPQQ